MRLLLSLACLGFGFVSDFEFRISDFQTTLRLAQ
jgi:hypothetical protein